MVGAPLEWNETMGEGIKVGIIDTGVCLEHIDLKHRIKEVMDFTGESKFGEDLNGHGTHVAGIVGAEKNGVGVIGVAPMADLYISKAFGKDGKCDYQNIEKSIWWMIDRKVDVINMSFSSPFTSPRYSKVIKMANKMGIVMICAVGNDGINTKSKHTYPSSFNETIAVSAVDINKNIADFSSRSDDTEIAAAGIDIYSTYLNGGYATLSGTSMATPIITGAVALLQSKGIMRYHRRLTPDEIRLLLNIYTEDLSGFGKDDRYGYGLFSFGRISGNDSVFSQSESVITNYKNLSTDMKKLISIMLSN